MNIYKVTINIGKSNPLKQTRLIRATSKAQAKGFAADDHITTEIASPDDLIALTKDGIEVEDAKGGA